MDQLDELRKRKGSCRCEGTDEEPWNPECPVHTIGHYYQPGCCDVKQAESGMHPHRHMTPTEYDAAYPKVYDSIFKVADRRYRLDARRYTDGVGATFTELFRDEDDTGMCFDIGAEVVEPLIAHLIELRDAIK
jgi:hypothetical protein